MNEISMCLRMRTHAGKNLKVLIFVKQSWSVKTNTLENFLAIWKSSKGALLSTLICTVYTASKLVDELDWKCASAQHAPGIVFGMSMPRTQPVGTQPVGTQPVGTQPVTPKTMTKLTAKRGAGKIALLG